MEDMNRYCSNVVTLTINASTTTTSTTTSTISTTTLTASLKTMIDGLVTSFMTKLDAKYPTSVSSKVTFLDALISRLESLTTGKYGAMFSYLQDKLQEQADILRIQSLLDI